MTQICITQARALLTDPVRAATRPGARALAWAMLKTAMGQTHRLDRLDPPARPTPVTDLAARLAETEATRLARIRARAAHHGITPTGGDAA